MHKLKKVHTFLALKYRVQHQQGPTVDMKYMLFLVEADHEISPLDVRLMIAILIYFPISRVEETIPDCSQQTSYSLANKLLSLTPDT